MNQYTVPNLVKAIDILRLLSLHPQGLTAVAIEKRAQVPRTTAFRILKTLISVGWARKEDHIYFTGPGLVEIGLNTLNKVEIRQRAVPILRELTKETGYTSHLAVPSGTQSLIVEVCDSPHPVRVASRPGSRVNMHCSSTGNVFLSYLYADQLETHLSGETLSRYTTNTLVDIPALQKMTQTVLRSGFAVDDRECNEDIRCLAAPVFDLNQQVIAAIGVTALTTRFTKQSIPAVSKIVVIAAQRLSEMLGATNT